MIRGHARLAVTAGAAVISMSASLLTGTTAFATGAVGPGLHIRWESAPPSMVAPTVTQRTGYDILRVNVAPLTLTVGAFAVSRGGLVTPLAVTLHVDDTAQDPPNSRALSAADGTRPHGWLFTPTDEQPSPADVALPHALGGSRDAAGLNIRASLPERGPVALASFVWLPPEISGVETLTVSIPGTNPPVSLTATVNVGIAGLEDLPENKQLYGLIGTTQRHPNNHWSTPATADTLRAVAQDYIDRQNNDAQLQRIRQHLSTGGSLTAGNFPYGFPDKMQINDISLPWGGLFDVDDALPWSAPHGGHRWGDEVDFRTNQLVLNPAVKPPLPVGSSDLVRQAHLHMFFALEQAIRAAGGDIFPEGDPPHIHVHFGSAPTVAGPLLAGPSSLLPGGDVLLSGEGFAPDSIVNFTLFSQPINIGSAMTDANGHFSVTVAIPGSTSCGAHTVTGTGETAAADPRELATSITVICRVPPTTLPRTGQEAFQRSAASAVLAGMVGGGLFLSGLMVLARRRRPKASGRG